MFGELGDVICLFAGFGGTGYEPAGEGMIMADGLFCLFLCFTPSTWFFCFSALAMSLRSDLL